MSKEILTPEEVVIVDGICDKIANKVFTEIKNINKLEAAYWGADKMFELLWPLVKNSYEEGYGRGSDEEAGIFKSQYKDSTEYLTTLLNKLKDGQ